VTSCGSESPSTHARHDNCVPTPVARIIER
jgi:hypothetical protein